MKKLMIMAVAMCAAVAANAAAFTWSNSGGGPVVGKIYDSSSTLLAEGTMAYLLCTSSLSQNDFLTGIRAADNAASYITSQAIAGTGAAVNSSGRVDQTASFNYGSAGNDYSFYYVILKGEEILISDVATAQGQASATANIAFANSATWSKNSLGDANYSTPGWYSAVPEPTSGLLLLLGMAGLALRRRRA